MGRGQLALADHFSRVFGDRRGSGRVDPPPPVSCPVPVRVLGRDFFSRASFDSPDAREQLRAMPESLWLLYHHPDEQGPRIILGAKLCVQQGGEAKQLFGTRPENFDLEIDTSALTTFLAAEYPGLLDPNLLQ